MFLFIGTMRKGFRECGGCYKPGIGWQSKHCTSCLVKGIFFMSALTPSEPWNGVPFHVKEELAR